MMPAAASADPQRGAGRRQPPGLLRRLPDEAAVAGRALRVAGLRPVPPSRLIAMARAARRLRTGAALSVAALRYGDDTALVDDQGALSFNELDRRTNAIANRWRAAGIGDGVGVGILCRNHRGFLDALGAATKVGARVMILNTEFAAPQVADVCRNEGVDLLVHDEDLTDAAADAELRLGRVVARGESTDGSGTTSLVALLDGGDPTAPPAVSTAAKVVLLTSGTTGTPKGATRSRPTSLAAGSGMLSMPIRGGEVTYVAPPMFHAWGFGHTMTALALGSTVVTAPRFDADLVLEAVADHRCTMLVTVPVLLRRLVDAEANGARDVTSLRIIASSGSQLDGALAAEAMDRFGDIVYNFYGSTEAASIALATPADLRSAPGCAGRPPRGVFVQVVDEDDEPLPPGCTGRIFVANGAGFGGYTGGTSKQFVRGMMSTGDLGHFDDDGRLFVDGRDDEMIVSGGENVFPREIEELLSAHPAIVEAAAVGVADAEFGHRLRAFVVTRPNVELDESEVQDFVRSHLARFKVPREVRFVDALPRNPAGKILKRQLAVEDA